MNLISFVARALLPVAGLCFAPTLAVAQAAAQAAAPLALVPAQRVAHAATAMLLASTRAGERIVAVGDHGVVLLSDDGGKTFRQAKSVPVDATLTGVSFVDAKQGWAAGQWGVILHSTDGGETWALQRSDVSADRPLFAVQFFDAQHGVAVGLWSLVLTTADGGATWQTTTLPIPEGAKKADLNLLGLFGDAKGRLYATAEKGMLLRSDDQGKTWAYLPTGYKGSFWAGIATPDGGLLAAGLRGSLFRSTDEGRTWGRLDSGGKSSITALAQVGKDVVAVGADGLVLRSTDGGASFKHETRADRLSLTSVVAAPDGHAVLFSRAGIVLDAAPAATTKP
ncbi:MAG: YCF48-related protein [Burkholderiales bacterium]